MLASIHPLGERARGRRWAVTVSAFIAGATSAGAAAGGLLGLVGATVRDHAGLPLPAVVTAVVVLCIVGGLLDLGWFGSHLPSVRRQVNEDWLHRYRGGVYGFGFGFQLGLSVATIVTTAAVYVTYAFAFLAASAPAGLAIGATFGSVRGLSVLLAARVEAPHQLWELHRRFQQWAPASRGITVLAQFAVVVAVLAAAAT